MNENQRTVTYAVVGAIALLIGFEPWNRASSTAPPTEEGDQLFKDFTNPLAATSLEIIKFDEDTAAVDVFKVALSDGRWRIPSHQDYPADAKDHLAAAATAMIGVEILNVVSSVPGEHEMFGVVEPDVKLLKPGMVGIGRRVTMRDANDKPLADVIIGKEEKERPNVRYVRRKGNDTVYRVSIKTDKLSTKFEDWIEKDLLKLNTFDINKLALNDYSLKQVLGRDNRVGISQVKASEMTLAFSDKDSKWNLEKLIEYDKNKPTTVTLTEGEELNTEKLNELKNSLDDLKIVDVERKPKGLNGDLTISPEVAKDEAALDELARSLLERGFFPALETETKLKIVSTDGELIVMLKDGIEYVLSFGQVTGGADGAPQADSKGGLNRYVMITAQLDQTAIPKPELKPLPGDEPAADAAKPEEPKADDKKPADKKADDKKPGDKKPADKKPADKKPEEKKPEEKKPELSPEEAAAKKLADEEARAAVEKSNKRLQDDYDEKLKKANEKVDDLNRRFADWYYVISDDVYKKIHLTRADVVKKKETKPGEGTAVEDFKSLDRDITVPKNLAPPKK